MWKYALRRADRSDLAELRAMHARSFAAYGPGHYATEAVTRFLERFGTVSEALVDEGRFRVAIGRDGAIVGSGGWSQLAPGYGQATGDGDTAPDIAQIRAVFVDPTIGRQGLATAIMRGAEAEAASAGVRLMRLKATLSGVAFYDRLAYARTGAGAIDLGDGFEFGYVAMQKPLTEPFLRAA